MHVAMRLSPAFVLLAISLIGSDAVNGAPIKSVVRRAPSPLPLGSSGVAGATVGHGPDLADLSVDTSGQQADVVAANISLCKENLFGIVGDDCTSSDASGAQGGQDNARSAASKGNALTGHPFNGQGGPVNVAVLNYGGDQSGNGSSKSSSSSKPKGAKKQAGTSKSKDGKGAKKGSQSSSTGNGKKPQGGKADQKPKSKPQGGQTNTNPSSSSPGKANGSGGGRAPSGDKEQAGSNTVQSKDKHPFVNVATSPSTKLFPDVNIGGSTNKSKANKVGAHRLNKDQSKTIGVDDNHSKKVNVDGSADGGSVDCSSHGGLLGLSSLNINSCNGGEGGKNIVGGSSSDDHRQSLLGVLRRQAQEKEDSTKLVHDEAGAQEFAQRNFEEKDDEAPIQEAVGTAEDEGNELGHPFSLAGLLRRQEGFEDSEEESAEQSVEYETSEAESEIAEDAQRHEVRSVTVFGKRIFFSQDEKKPHRDHVSSDEQKAEGTAKKGEDDADENAPASKTGNGKVPQQGQFSSDEQNADDAANEPEPEEASEGAPPPKAGQYTATVQKRGAHPDVDAEVQDGDVQVGETEKRSMSRFLAARASKVETPSDDHFAQETSTSEAGKALKRAWK